MNDYHLLKQQARALRKQGKSYGDINKELGVAKSTLSYWLKDVALTEEQRRRLYTNQIAILSRGAPSQRERRKREVAVIIEQAEREISPTLSAESYRLFGAALYWAEGNKKSGFAITNSDPSLILFMVNWFGAIFGIPPARLKAHLNIYPQQSEQDVKQFWSQLTGIPLENFGKSFVKPMGKQ